MGWIATLIALITKWWPAIQAIIAAISSIAVPAAAHIQLQAAKVEALSKGFAGPSDLTWWMYVPGQAAAGLSLTAFLSVLQSFNSEAHVALDRHRKAKERVAALEALRAQLSALPASDVAKVVGTFHVPSN